MRKPLCSSPEIAAKQASARPIRSCACVRIKLAVGLIDKIRACSQQIDDCFSCATSTLTLTLHPTHHSDLAETGPK